MKTMKFRVGITTYKSEYYYEDTHYGGGFHSVIDRPHTRYKYFKTLKEADTYRKKYKGKGYVEDDVEIAKRQIVWESV